MTLPPWHLHLDVWLFFGSLAAVYLIAARRHEARTGETTPRGRRVLFFTGLGLLWLASDWPMHDLSEGYLYSAHMVQHMMFTLVAAPLLVTGMPAWMWRAILAPAPIRRVFGFLVKPLMAIVVFNGVLLFTHWPSVVEASVGSEPIHFLLHVLVVGSGIVMWWPIVSPLPEMPPISPPAQMLYLFFQSLAPTIPASFLTFGHEPLYAIYETFPRIWGISAMSDQMAAGLIMKIAGGLILWGVIAAVFFRWANREQRDGFDALQWHGIDAEIRTELTR
jgi:putative membrane protein